MLQVDGPPALETLRRDQLARRQRIVRAALRALANGDYEQVKVSEVARDSGVALGTLYRYFSSKEHLFAAVILEWQDAHGCEPWEDLAVTLMLKWPNLYYSTSAFAPKYYPQAVIRYANSRGADKVIYGGYFPMGLSLERIFSDMPQMPFKDEVWPKFLSGNARRVLGLDKG